MPKIDQLQGAFNAGELSPLLYGRTENPRYKQGLATCLNYIPTLQGPLGRRPGTKFMNLVKDSTTPPVLIPFQFSITQAYILEFGAGYIRFYANNGQIVTTGTTYKGTALKSWNSIVYYSRTSTLLGQNEVESSGVSVTSGSILEILSPYNSPDLVNLRYVQSFDTLYLMHPNYPVFKLQRFAQDLWELTQVYFQDGPYLPINSYSNTGDSTNIQLTPLNTSLPVQEVQTYPNLTVSNMTTDPSGSGQISVTVTSASGFTNGQQVFINGVSGTVEANNYDYVTGSYNTHPVSWTIQVTSTTSFLLVGSTFTNAYSSGGMVYPALFAADVTAEINLTAPPDLNRLVALDIGGARYWGTFYSGYGSIYRTFQNASRAFVYMGNDGGTQFAFPSTTTSTVWQLGVYWYGINFPTIGNFPAEGSFHQSRLCLSGVPNNPQEIDGSMTGQFENFAPNLRTSLVTADNYAFSFSLVSNDANVLRWLKSTAQGLLSGSYVAEWAVEGSSSTSDALTNTNVNTQQTSFYGSANSEAVQLGNAVIYIQRANRKIREMNFFFQVGTFRSTDMTELSEHITLPGVSKLVLQKETQPLVWALRNDGNIISMIYDRTDTSLIAGWTRHILGGQSDSGGTNPIVHSFAVIPSQDLTFDQMWLIVQRYINGSTVYTIEYMTKIFDDSILQEDAFQGDCGATFDNPLTITGISTASTAVVTSTGNGLSNGDQIRIVSVVGLNKSQIDANGNVTIVNLVNEKTFVVAGVTTNTFQLNDFNGNPISSIGYGAYVSGGQVRKLVTTITGLTWLEGETVGVLTDGGIHPDVIVSNSGSITLNYPAAKVQIGYRFNSDGQLLRLEGGAADGTSIGKTRRTTRVAAQLHRSGELSIGTSFTNLIPIEFAQQDQNQADNATPLFSGIKRDGIESAYDFESQVCFRMSSMLPGNIISITSFMEEQDI